MTFHSGVNCFKPSSFNTFHPHCHPAESNPPAPISAFTHSCLKSKNKSSPPLVSCSRPKTFSSLEIIPGTEERFTSSVVEVAQHVAIIINSSKYVWPRYRPLCLRANWDVLFYQFFLVISLTWTSLNITTWVRHRSRLGVATTFKINSKTPNMTKTTAAIDPFLNCCCGPKSINNVSFNLWTLNIWTRASDTICYMLTVLTLFMQTSEEVSEKMTGLQIPVNRERGFTMDLDDNVTKLPKYIDYRKRGMVTPVKDQVRHHPDL